MSVTKIDLAEALYMDVGLNKCEANEFVDMFFDSIKEVLVAGKDVKLSGFGNFELRDKKSRPGRNPKTLEEVTIPPRRIVAFKPGQKIKDTIETYAGSRTQ
ncbi:MAG: integration host factor subunit alpha [Proteobacteria bacterium]|nr:integration host factor subunit alpha [Pseudomonadota bacterium]